MGLVPDILEREGAAAGGHPLHNSAASGIIAIFAFFGNILGMLYMAVTAAWDIRTVYPAYIVWCLTTAVIVWFGCPEESTLPEELEDDLLEVAVAGAGDGGSEAGGEPPSGLSSTNNVVIAGDTGGIASARGGLAEPLNGGSGAAERGRGAARSGERAGASSFTGSPASGAGVESSGLTRSHPLLEDELLMRGAHGTASTTSLGGLRNSTNRTSSKARPRSVADAILDTLMQMLGLQDTENRDFFWVFVGRNRSVLGILNACSRYPQCLFSVSSHLHVIISSEKHRNNVCTTVLN